jgi:RpiB/LacA/LacB family sugar-phosphate isomerase
MRIALASDHAAYDLKTGIARYLAAHAIPFEDLGCGPGESVDYPEYAAKAAERVQAGACDRAILCCGTGIGMAVAANKFKGIRATPCWSAFTAEVSRKHNDSNCLSVGGRTLGLDEALEIVRVWLETPFEGGRHARRVDEIKALEERNFKA